MKKPGAAVTRGLPPLLCAGASFLLTTVVVLTAWAMLPVAFGWTPVAITSGSMGPHVRVGDVVVVDTHDGRELDPSTVITFRESDRLVTHRIVSIDEEGRYTTKGDANADRDSTPVTDDAIIGSARILVPFMGRPLIWLATGQLGLLGLWAVVVLAAVPLARPGRQAARSAEQRAPSDAAAPAPNFSPAHLESGVVWHAGALPRPAEDRERRVDQVRGRPAAPHRGLIRTAMTTLAVVVLAGGAATAMLLSETAAAAFSGAAINGGTWSASQLDSPSDVSASAGCSVGSAHIDITWTPSTDADGYDVHRRVAPDGAWELRANVAGGGTDAWRDDDVSAGTYDYRLEATASSWRSLPSASASGTVDDGLCV